jgi:hypothetical protein
MNSARKTGKNCLCKTAGETLKFHGLMVKTQLLKITKHHVIVFDKKKIKAYAEPNTIFLMYTERG